MLSKKPYWLRGGLIGTLLGILFYIILSALFHEPLDLLSVLFVILPASIFSGALGFLGGGLIGSVFDIIKNKKFVPLIVFGVITLLLIGFIMLIFTLFFGPATDCLIDYSNYTIPECNKVRAMACNGYCIAEASIKGNDYTICDKLTGYMSRYESCYERFAATNKNISICEKIPINESELWRNMCYERVAAALKNVSVCNLIWSSDEDKFQCVIGVAKAQKNLSICPTTNNPEYCSIEVAINMQDSSVCASLTWPGMSDECYARIGMATANASICEKITRVNYNDVYGREQCYRTAAAKSNDPTICEKITNKDLRKSCYTWVKVQIFKRELYWENKTIEP